MHGLERYEILKHLGRGGMGSVHLARDKVLGRLVAVKRLRAGGDDEGMRRRFEREARILAALQHPNVISVFDFFEVDGDPFLVMEYLEGETLRTVIAEQRPWSLARKLEIIEHLCDGLESVHRAGIVHRDVKPANLMLTRDGAIKLLDFGVAKTPGTALTQPRMAVGSPNYMSPEQIRGEPLDARSDVFALAAVLYELVAYTPPFPGDMPQAFQAILAGQPAPLSTLVLGVTARLDRLVERGLAKASHDRWGSVAHLASELRAIQADLSAATTRHDNPPAASVAIDRAVSVEAASTPVDAEDAPAAGHRQLVAGIAAGAAAIVVVLVGLWSIRTTPAEAPRATVASGNESGTPSRGVEGSEPKAIGRRETRRAGPRTVPSSTAAMESSPPPSPRSESDEPVAATRTPTTAPGTAAVPPGNLAAPVESAPPAAAPADGADEAEIHAVLSAYERAHADRSVPAIKSIFPDLPQSSVLLLERQFLDTVEYRLALSNMAIRRRDASAQVTCRATRSYTPVRGDARNVVSRLMIEMRKRDDGWVIVAIDEAR